MLKIACVLGTRPEVIKLAPVIIELKKHRRVFDVTVISTAQHRQMLDQILQVFHIIPDIDLDIMKVRQTLKDITINSLNALDTLFSEMHPDIVLVQGDTTTAFSAGLTAFYHHIKIGHIEAGLRSYDWENPFPEEMNRILLSHLTSFHFAPTQSACDNLLRENIQRSSIHITGNTVIDALFIALESTEHHLPDEISKLLQWSGFTFLLTTHRRENIGTSMESICRAVKDLVIKYPAAQLIFPVHLNPAVRDIVFPILDGHPRIHLIAPQEYHSFVHIMKHSKIILTDSGGIQEEAPSLGIPVLVLRSVTERPEASIAGTAKIIGTDYHRIIEEASRLLDFPDEYAHMAALVNPYGDGHASQRIVNILAEVNNERNRG